FDNISAEEGHQFLEEFLELCGAAVRRLVITHEAEGVLGVDGVRRLVLGGQLPGLEELDITVAPAAAAVTVEGEAQASSGRPSNGQLALPGLKRLSLCLLGYGGQGP